MSNRKILNAEEQKENEKQNSIKAYFRVRPFPKQFVDTYAWRIYFRCTVTKIYRKFLNTLYNFYSDIIFFSRGKVKLFGNKSICICCNHCR